MSAIIERRRMQFAGIPTCKAFSACTVAEIGKFAPYARLLVSAGIWTIGDVNTSVNYGGYTGGIQLVHCLTDEQRGSSYYNTEGHIVVQFVNTVAKSDYMVMSGYRQKYFEPQCILHSTCNTTIYGALDSTFKALLEPWTCNVGRESYYSSGIYSQSVYMAVPTAKEVGSTNEYNSDENDACFVFDYYSDTATVQERRQKSGAITNWWLRSPSFEDDDGTYGYRIIADGSIDGYFVDIGSSYGVAPIAVI